VSENSLIWEEGRLALAGPVTIATVTPLLKQLDNLLQGKPEGEVLVDCRKVTLSDSAVIALLLELERKARKQDIVIRVEGMREQLARLVAIYGVEWLLAPSAQ